VWDSDRIAEQSVPEVADGEEDIIREDAMQELLRAVDLEYLLERHGMHTVLDWGHILSLGAPPPHPVLPLCTHAVLQEYMAPVVMTSLAPRQTGRKVEVLSMASWPEIMSSCACRGRIYRSKLAESACNSLPLSPCKTSKRCLGS